MNIIPFIFDTLPVRAVLRDGEPWFVAADVCAVLEIVDIRQAVERLDNSERGGCTVPTPGGPQEVRAVNESGLYALIFTSRKPEAQRFRRWVTGEVLPSIRKTGGYRLDDHARPQVSDFRRTQPAEYVISPYTFAEVICSGLDARKVALALRDAGHLRHEADRCTITQRLPGEGGKVKVYAIKPEILH